MPKGSPPNIIHTKTWAGDVVRPGRTKAQLAARFKNKTRENFPSTSQYREDVKARKAKLDVRSDASVKRAVKKFKAPVGKGGR